MVGAKSYYFGIIDYQQKWTLSKKVERWLKGVGMLTADAMGISSQEPEFYKERYVVCLSLRGVLFYSAVCLCSRSCSICVCVYFRRFMRTMTELMLMEVPPPVSQPESGIGSEVESDLDSELDGGDSLV